MGDLLSSLGLTAMKPDPAALVNQQQVNAQLGGIKLGINDTLGSIDLAMKGADILGVSPEYKDKLAAIKTQGATLASATNLSPVELEKKRAELDKTFSAVQAEQEASIDERQIKEATDAVEAIEKRTKEVEDDSTTSKGLLEKYRDLRTRSKEMLETVKTNIQKAKEAKAKLKAEAEAKALAEATLKKEGFQSAAATTPAAAATPAASTTTSFFALTPKDALRELELLDLEKQAEEDKEFNIRRAAARTAAAWRTALVTAAIVIGGIVGGIITANAYIGERFWALKLYYFIYGAVFFPASLLYALIRPPFWQATFIPFYQRQGPTTASIAEWLFSYEPINQDSFIRRISGSRTRLRILAGLVLAGCGTLAGVYRLDQYLVKGG